MRLKRFHWQLVCWLLVATAISHAQQYPFLKITGPNAPPGAGYLFEDTDGGLWIAGAESGADGLRYFDGSRFYSPLKDGFPNTRASGIAEDSEKGIWISSDAGLSRVYQGRLHKILDGVADVGISTIARDVLLTVMGPVLGKPGGKTALVRVSKVNGQWKTETVMEPFPSVRLQADGAGHLLFACDGGFCEIAGNDVARWRPGVELKVTHYVAPTLTNYGKHGGLVWRDRFGCVWMRSQTDASYQCPQDKIPVTLPASIASVGNPTILELADGSVVLASFSKLAIGRPGKFRVISATNGYPGTGYALAAKDGGVWLSNANGLFVFSTRFPLEFWSERDGLGGNTWSILLLGKKTLAIAGDSIRILDQDRSRWLQWSPLADATHLEAGPGGTVLAASLTEGVVQFSAQGKVLRRSAPGEVVTIAQGPDAQLWAAGSGISKVAFNKREFALQPQDLPTQPARILNLKFDRFGRLWACGDTGLLHEDGNKWRSFSAKNGLKDTPCINFAIDRQQDIWYAYLRIPALTLIRNPASDHSSFQDFRGAVELGRSQANFFESDRRGWLWRGTPDGIYVADLEQAKQDRWLHLNRSDGLPAIDANQTSFREDVDGSIWYGADNSVIHMFPADDLVRPRYSPSVFISGFSWNGGPAQMADMVSAIKGGTDIVAHVGSLQFDRRNALRLRYRLLPEQAWTGARELSLHLGVLPWGAHRLEVQAQLGTGPWSPTQIKEFTVLRPFWLSWPALMGFVATVGTGTAWVARWRRNRAQRAKTIFPDIAEWRLAVLSPEIQSLKGKVLDSRFEVGRILARGGFATVVEGRDLQRDGLPCAVKIFRRELVDKDWMAKRFRHEVSALEQILHANVVRIYGHGTTREGSLYLVMEFIDGQTLREILESRSIGQRETASYLRQIGSALGEIHAHGVCHRDLKPDNLMIRKEGPPGQEVVLIDFSIAIVKDPDETLHGLSRAAGTIYYMAPEQGIGYADASSDIYSLAKIVIEMLTGQRLSALLPDASIDLPDRVRELLTQRQFGLSKPSIDLIGQALEFHPLRRPNDANEFAAMIAFDLETGAKDVQGAVL